MELRRDRPISHKASSHRFIQAAAGETITPRDSDINEETDNCCARNSQHRGHTFSCEIGGAMDDMRSTRSPFIGCRYFDGLRAPRQAPEMGGGRV
jgi:hypothetical protein